MGDAEDAGCNFPTDYDPLNMPSKVVVESSSWFMEQLFGKSDGVPQVKLQTVERIVYQDNPATLNEITQLKDALQQALRAGSKAKDTRAPSTFSDFFRQEDKGPITKGAPTVRGYPGTN